jgi:hypothetical protein
MREVVSRQTLGTVCDILDDYIDTRISESERLLFKVSLHRRLRGSSNHHFKVVIHSSTPDGDDDDNDEHRDINPTHAALLLAAATESMHLALKEENLSASPAWHTNVYLVTFPESYEAMLETARRVAQRMKTVLETRRFPGRRRGIVSLTETHGYYPSVTGTWRYSRAASIGKLLAGHDCPPYEIQP